VSTRRQKPPAGPTLLERAAERGTLGSAPLAERMRPASLEEIVGHDALLAPGSQLERAIAEDRLMSMILWGPPGSGKTTLAKVIARRTKKHFEPFSAVLGGVPELREIIAQAEERRSYEGRSTILFVDEIHRFNKSQQDAFLPHVERGTLTLIGATTENPSFSVNAALLSRSRVFRLHKLEPAALEKLLARALADSERGFGQRPVTVEPKSLELIAKAADGDARRALGLLEASMALVDDGAPQLSPEVVAKAAEERTLLYDKSGEEHYNVVSAFIKSMRGSDPDAAVYWMMRMLEAGDDPLFVLRRMLIFASEDVGNADPQALAVAVSADAAFRRLGMPEGLYPLAHACLYLASCPKSNAVGRAFHAARDSIREQGALPVPDKLRNAVTALMKNEGYGTGYRYAHDYAGSYVPGETYLPDALAGTHFYEPSHEGFEQTFFERLAALRSKKPL
jgi:putative ATPase